MSLLVELPHIFLATKTGSMASLGRVRAFNASSETWVEYTERLGQYFIAKDTPDEIKRPILLSQVGASTYHLIKSLTAPSQPTEKTYAELVVLVRKHLEPSPTVTVQSHKFNMRVRKQGESVAEFLAALRGLSEHCEFGTAIQDTLRDRVVCDIGDRYIQRKLLAEADLTYDKAVDIAVSMSTADKDSKEMGSNATRLHPRSYITQAGPKAGAAAGGGKKDTSTGSCNSCGGKHNRLDCQYLNATCRRCGKKGALTSCISQWQPSAMGEAS